MDLTEDTLAARMALASIGRPGFGALQGWKGKPHSLAFAGPDKKGMKGYVGQNWTYDPKGNVNIYHGYRDLDINEGFNPDRGRVFATPDREVALEILRAQNIHAPGTHENMGDKWRKGAGILEGSIPPRELAAALGVSTLGEQELVLEYDQANKRFGIGPKPNIMSRIMTALSPSVVPSQYLGPINIDERLGIKKDDYAYHKIMGKTLVDKIPQAVAKAVGSVGRALPVAGQTLGAIDVTNRIDEGDYLGAGLSGIGMIPAVGVPALAALGAYDAYDIVNNPSTGPEPMSVPSAFTTPQYGDQAYRSFDPVMPDPIPTE